MKSVIFLIERIEEKIDVKMFSVLSLTLIERHPVSKKSLENFFFDEG
jgi:hypothetical protein